MVAFFSKRNLLNLLFVNQLDLNIQKSKEGMKKTLKIKRNVLRNLIGVFSFTTALFVFQACYGTPQDFGQDILIEGQVVSKASGEAIEGIAVNLNNNLQQVITDNEGKFELYTETASNYKLSFEDIDQETNGIFTKLDTTFTSAEERIYLNIQLEN